MKASDEYEKGKSFWIRFFVLIFLALFVAIFSGVPSYEIVNSIAIDNRGITAPGVVDSIESISNTDTEALRFRVSFQFRGKKYTIFNKFMTNESIYELNQKVMVKFLPDNPAEAVIDSTREKYTGYTINIVLGTIIIVTALFFIIKKDNPFLRYKTVRLKHRTETFRVLHCF